MTIMMLSTAMKSGFAHFDNSHRENFIAAMLLLKAQGYEKVKSVKGGMGAWMQENRPLKLR